MPLPCIASINFSDLNHGKKNITNAWNGQQESDKVYKDAWHDFLNTDYAKCHVPNWIDNL